MNNRPLKDPRRAAKDGKKLPEMGTNCPNGEASRREVRPASESASQKTGREAKRCTFHRGLERCVLEVHDRTTAHRFSPESQPSGVGTVLGPVHAAQDARSDVGQANGATEAQRAPAPTVDAADVPAKLRGPKLKTLSQIRNQQAVTYREFKLGKIERAVATARARLLEGLARTAELALLERQIAIAERDGGGVLEVRHVRGGES